MSPVVLLLLSLALSGTSAAQGPLDDSYLVGDANRLEMVVYVLGEVVRPGEYRVTDDTDVLELISKAGGPTEFASLANVSLRRRDPAGAEPDAERILHVNVSEFLSQADAPPLPGLNPGDVVMVPRNGKAKWRYVFTMVRDLSVVVSMYLLYLNIIHD
jgi:polysaccharide export outer membrane protein